MKNKTNKHSIVEGTFGSMRRVDDFLPAPEDLVLKDASAVKVTMSLDQDTIDYLKKQAKKFNASYQRMIRNLLNEYVSRYK